MLSSKIYKTTEQTYCDKCSMEVISEQHGTPMYREESGKPCTCDRCGLRFKSL